MECREREDPKVDTLSRLGRTLSEPLLADECLKRKPKATGITARKHRNLEK